MAPAILPKRRVKSMKKRGGNAIARIRKRREDKQFSRAYINKVIKKVLKGRVSTNDPVLVIYKTYRRLIKKACESVVRRYRRMTVKEARMAMAKLIPRELAMNAIREFRQQPAGDMVASPAPPADA